MESVLVKCTWNLMYSKPLHQSVSPAPAAVLALFFASSWVQVQGCIWVRLLGASSGPKQTQCCGFCCGASHFCFTFQRITVVICSITPQQPVRGRGDLIPPSVLITKRRDALHLSSLFTLIYNSLRISTSSCQPAVRERNPLGLRPYSTKPSLW